MTTLQTFGVFAAASGLLCTSPVLAQTATLAAKQGAAKSAAKYVVRKAIALTPAVHGASGRLELLTDERVKPDMDDAQTFDFAHAKIRVANPDGSVSQEKTLERSRATLDKSPPLYGKSGRPTYLLTVDYSADMGSYNGPITFLVEVVNGAMHFVPANSQPLSLMRSLKTDWKFSLAKSRDAQSTDILEVACRPNNTKRLADDDINNDFTVFYRRYHWNGREWVKCERSRIGFWEDDGNFPKLALFPPAQP